MVRCSQHQEFDLLYWWCSKNKNSRYCACILIDAVKEDFQKHFIEKIQDILKYLSS